jgi:hypothetical protein
MNAVYHIGGIETVSGGWRQALPAASITHFPWAAAGDFCPVSAARVAYNADALFVYMESDETSLRAEQRGFGYVHTDSCMEFFLMPDPASSPRYFNWEFNPAGGMYLSLGTERFNRIVLSEHNYRELFQVRTMTHNSGWTLEYRIPLAFARRFFPALDFRPGNTMRGNFYKCGDETAHPHFGCWSPIDLPQPDFHCPDFFGELVFD